MLYLILDILAVRRNEEDEGWGQILVFILMAVFWIGGGILKARRNRWSGEDDSDYNEDIDSFAKEDTGSVYHDSAAEGPVEDPASQPSEITEKQIRHRAFQRLRELERKFQVPEEEKPRPTKPKPVKKRVDYLSRKNERKTSASEDSAYDLNIGEQDELRKAVIYAEILGKPASMKTDRLFD